MSHKNLFRPKFKSFRLIILLTNIFISMRCIYAAVKIEVIYPKEGSLVTAFDSTFIFGNVSLLDVQFSVNNQPIELYPNGAFIAYVPITPGNFSFVCQAVVDNDTTRVARNVYIPYYFKTSPSALTIDTSYVFPNEDWELQPGDVFKVAVKGSPGGKATFSIEGLVQNLPMKEVPLKKSFYWGEAFSGNRISFRMPDVHGIYIGIYPIQSWDWATQRSIRFKLRDKGGNSVETIAAGRLNIDHSDPPKIAKLTREINIAQNGSDIGGQYFLSESVKVKITGRRGSYGRVRFSEAEEVWIKDENLEMLPSGTPLPDGAVDSIQIAGYAKKSRVKIILDRRVPFKIEQNLNPAALLVTLYGVTTKPNLIKVDVANSLISEIHGEEKATDVYEIKINLKQDRFWGYDPVYEDDNLCIDIKKKPEIHDNPFSSLKDIVICLDPGHSPDLGAIGPTGIAEQEMNYQYCLALKDELQKRGANVFLTRGELDSVTLAARTEFAVAINADILLSLHFNALPDGVNPFKNRGVSTYYYHPQSHRLAYLIQKALLNYTRLPDFGLFYNNLTMVRPTQMIAVLTEPGFIMHPWEEILIASESYRAKVVIAIVRAIEEFLRETK